MTAAADEIASDVADIIAVVLGAEQIPLDRPRRILALQAMNALGYSVPYMSAQLGVQPRTIPSLASALKVKLNPTRWFVDVRAVEWVVAGTPMKLRGNDLDAALTGLHARGAHIAEIARLTKSSWTLIREHAGKLGLDLIEDPEAECWWNRYYETARPAEKDD